MFEAKQLSNGGTIMWSWIGAGSWLQPIHVHVKPLVCGWRQPSRREQSSAWLRTMMRYIGVTLHIQPSSGEKRRWAVENLWSRPTIAIQTRMQKRIAKKKIAVPKMWMKGLCHGACAQVFRWFGFRKAGRRDVSIFLSAENIRVPSVWVNCWTGLVLRLVLLVGTPVLNWFKGRCHGLYLMDTLDYHSFSFGNFVYALPPILLFRQNYRVS